VKDATRQALGYSATPFPQYTVPYIFLDLRVERYCGNALSMVANFAELPELLRGRKCSAAMIAF
jgi:hypothetical protein